MSFFHKKPDWYLPETDATPESIYFRRREILRMYGYGGLALWGGLALPGCAKRGEPNEIKNESLPEDGNERQGETTREHGSEFPRKPSTESHEEFGPNETNRESDDGGSQEGTSERFPEQTRENTPETIPEDAPRVGSKPSENYPPNAQASQLYPPKRNPKYKVSERKMTPEDAASTFNNYYEFTVSKTQVWKQTTQFHPTPWTVEIGGLVKKERKFDVDQLLRQMGLEERVYRFRCVEAWAMTVPWSGFPLQKLLKLADVHSSARYVRFLTANLPKQMPGIPGQPWYPWPYHEALRLDEANNELAFVATGIYGHPLPRQMGAPMRLVIPWKYGYKSIKAIVRIEFTAKEPKTFWNTLIPDEYGFYSNVNPKKPHPRWSQAKERLIPDMDEVDTLLYNGYGSQVASLYKGNEF